MHRDIRDQVDEKIIGQAAVESSKKFFSSTFFKIVGENFDVVIHRHLEQVTTTALLNIRLTHTKPG